MSLCPVSIVDFANGLKSYDKMLCELSLFNYGFLLFAAVAFDVNILNSYVMFFDKIPKIIIFSGRCA